MRRIRGSLLAIAVLAPLAGALAGAIGALFRAALDQAEGWRASAIAHAHGSPGSSGSIETVVAIAGATALAACSWCKRFARLASGSGIPTCRAGAARPGGAGHVPPAAAGQARRWLASESAPARSAARPSRADGGDTPPISSANGAGSTGEDCRMLLAAGAGAGLATAFDAPIAGAVFVMEELERRFETRTAIAALRSLGDGDHRSRGPSSATCLISMSARSAAAGRLSGLHPARRLVAGIRGHRLQPRHCRHARALSPGDGAARRRQGGADRRRRRHRRWLRARPRRWRRSADAVCGCSAKGARCAGSA